jgi:hypothetical protein
MFDLLSESAPGYEIVHHIIHLASREPDSAAHPRHNECAALDALTWDTLPAELKKASYLHEYWACCS